jgi:hypothetical protein
LGAAGVSFEDRQDLLGHRSGRITTHYSAAELSRLIAAANRAWERRSKKPELVMLRTSSSTRIHAVANMVSRKSSPSDPSQAP